MPVLVRETYEIVTPESAEHGDAEDRGWIDEAGTEYDFRDLVSLLEGTEPSCWPLPGARDYCGNVWFTRYSAIEGRDFFELGREESRSYHPADDRAARYMAKAWREAHRWTPVSG